MCPRGAKTALTLALESPHLVKDILAIDNCPIHLPLEPEFERYLEALARLRDERVRTHQEADRILAKYEEVCHITTPNNIFNISTQ